MFSRAQVKRCLKKITAPYYRKNLKNREFSIISNNCWGGAIYDHYNLPYRTPTIGLWIPPKDYIKFISDLEYYVKQDIVQISWRDSHIKKLLEERKASGRYTKDLDEFIIGRIVDVDVVFIHYDSFDVAREKWNRRKQRINFKNLIIKFNDQNGATRNELLEFIRKPYENKLVFTVDKSLEGMDSVVCIQDYAKTGYVVDDIKSAFKVMDVTEFLNSVQIEE